MARLEKPGGYQIRIIGNKSGVNKKGGTWVLLSVVDSQTGDDTKIMFSLPNKGVDSDKAFEIKGKIWNEFVKNCGVNPEQDVDDILSELNNKEVKAVLRLKDKVIFGNQDGKPLIVKNIEYYYSVAMDKQLTVNQEKLTAGLTQWEENFYQDKLNEWKKENEGANTDSQQDESMPDIPVPSADDDDDLPF